MAHLVAVWPELPQAIRSGIAAMVDAALPAVRADADVSDSVRPSAAVSASSVEREEASGLPQTHDPGDQVKEDAS